MDDLKFKLGQHVRLKTSDEEGHVEGRAEYEASEPSYYIRYRGGDGRQIEAWWGESALTEA